MPTKNKGVQIIENIRKNDPRFKNVINKKSNNIWTLHKEVEDVLESKIQEKENSL